MLVAVTTDHRFFRTPDGAIWTDGLNPYQFWRRYLETFAGVRVIARVQDVDVKAAHFRRADGDGVDFHPVPNFFGPWQYLTKASQIRCAVRTGVARDDAVILRVSSHLAGCLEPLLLGTAHPYGVEVINDPYDVFAPGAVRYSMRPLFRWRFTRQLRRQCRAASAAAYVTERALQARYPCSGSMMGISDVELPDSVMLELDAGARTYSRRANSNAHNAAFGIVTVASLAQLYKATDVLIRAVAECIHMGWNLTLNIIGDGKHRKELEDLSVRLGVRDSVQFLGQLPPGDAVREQLDASDLFVLPSRCEGLPRAMIEAMARSLPCIGSTVGGIPELLAPDDLVAPGNVGTLAAKIRETLGCRLRLSAMSERNFQKALQYRESLLAQHRKAFLEQVRCATLDWLRHPRLSGSPETAEVLSGR